MENIKWNPVVQDSPPAAGREATNSVPPQCDPRGALFCFTGNATQFPVKQKGCTPSSEYSPQASFLSETRL